MFPRIKNTAAAVAILLLFFVPGFLPYRGADGSLTEKQALLWGLLLRVPVLIPVLWLSLSGGPDGRRSRGWKKPGGPDYLLMILLPVFTLSLGWLLPGKQNFPDRGDAVLRTLLLAHAFLAVLTEESFFRSWFLSDLFTEGQPMTAPVVFSSVLFSILHFWQGTNALVFSFITALVYSAVFLRRRNIWILLAAHGIHNLLAIVPTDIP